MLPLLIIQNDAKEGAGQLLTLLSRRGMHPHVVMGPSLPELPLDAGRFGGLVVLGGAQGAYETADYPYLGDEMRLCERFIAKGRPVAGFCLGAQILACALGGTVVPTRGRRSAGTSSASPTRLAMTPCCTISRAR